MLRAWMDGQKEISKTIIDRGIKFSGVSCVFLEEISYISHSGLITTILTAVERPILKLLLHNFGYSFYFFIEKLTFSDYC